jgi:hypothetical protein
MSGYQHVVLINKIKDYREINVKSKDGRVSEMLPY